MISQDDIDAFKESGWYMTLDTYQKKAITTAIYPKEVSIMYPALGLAGEAGEVANKVKKLLRDKKLDRDGIKSELGDCLWYIAVLAEDLGISLSSIASDNLEKLGRRKAKGTLNGNGDER
jgi:NTP pyrophosphatase (non-canonical NTP hydrolase)